VSNIRELSERTGIDRSEISDLLDTLREKGRVKTVRRKEGGPILWELSDQGRSVLPPSTPEGYASIGGSEAQGLALAARDYYLSRGWFFAIARQDAGMSRKVDCVAYDYDGKIAVGVEIESSEHVFHDHIEQTKRHMLEIAPFDEMHFWAHKEATERISELKSQLRPEDQAKVKVLTAE